MNKKKIIFNKIINVIEESIIAPLNNSIGETKSRILKNFGECFTVENGEISFKKNRDSNDAFEKYLRYEAIAKELEFTMPVGVHDFFIKCINFIDITLWAEQDLNKENKKPANTKAGFEKLWH